MLTSSITIDERRVVITPASDGTVWMTQHEIAETFGVFVSAVGMKIRSIFKNNILREDRVHREIHHKNGSITTLYNLEMVVALAF